MSMLPHVGYDKELNTTTLTYRDPECVLTLPYFNEENKNIYDTFVFYCFTFPHGTAAHSLNYKHFRAYVLPDLQTRTNVYTCVLCNDKEQNLSFHFDTPNCIHIQRPNRGFDFGAYFDAISFTRLHMRKLPFYLLCMNDTVYGPLFPPWLNPKPDWLQILRNLIDSETKIVGMSINPHNGRPHVQSMIFMVDHVGFQIAWQADVFFSRKEKHDVIECSEIEMSRVILEQGFNINCLATLLHGIDYRKKDNIPNHIGDACVPGHYHPQGSSSCLSSLHPFDSMFCKTTRYGLQTCIALTSV